MKNFRDYGFSLMEITVSMALLGGLTLGVMKLGSEVSTAKSRGNYLMDVTLFGNTLNHYLYTEAACKYLFTKSETGGPGIIVPQTTSPFNLGPFRFQGKQNIVTGTKLNNFEIRNLVARQELTSLPTTKINGQDVKKTIVEISLTVGPKRVDVSGVQEQLNKVLTKTESKFSYNVPVISKANGEIVSCGDAKDLKEICNSTLGEYNEITKACDFKNTCKATGTIFELTCSAASSANAGRCDTSKFGPTVNNQFSNTTSCPSGSAATQTGYETWDHNIDCGKKCNSKITNHSRWYICMECP